MLSQQSVQLLIRHIADAMGNVGYTGLNVGVTGLDRRGERRDFLHSGHNLLGLITCESWYRCNDLLVIII